MTATPYPRASVSGIFQLCDVPRVTFAGTEAKSLLGSQTGFTYTPGSEMTFSFPEKLRHRNVGTGPLAFTGVYNKTRNTGLGCPGKDISICLRIAWPSSAPRLMSRTLNFIGGTFAGSRP